MIQTMIRRIPEGYFATAPAGENGHHDFLRIKTQQGKRSHWNGALTVQTLHGDKWSDPAIAFWPSERISVYREPVIEMVMLILQDYKTAGLRYAIMLEKCMRCGKQLTDDRSRHYLVGPECENKHEYTWPIAFADEWNEATFEQLRHVGKQYNQHHQHLGQAA